ncbi:MAG: hypothetical protein KY467_05560 [Gemmatimonadetes bacterium]|nr:hypothetical protein [Gemmatimonadota bacterium]
MTDPIPPAEHSPEFIRLCERAIGELEALKADPPMERGPRLITIRALLADVGLHMAEVDLRTPGFADEQGTLVDAASALQAIDLDRGGPNVPRFADRIIADLRRIATGG